MLFNSEVEFEHATTGEGSEEKGEVSVEFAYLDFLLSQPFNARAGMVLAPIGLINESHEPIAFHGVRRPDVETQIIPSTWRGVGAGIFGEILPGLQYRTYIMEGLRAKEFTKSDVVPGVNSGQWCLSKGAVTGDQLDYMPIPQATF